MQMGKRMTVMISRALHQLNWAALPGTSGPGRRQEPGRWPSEGAVIFGSVRLVGLYDFLSRAGYDLCWGSGTGFWPVPDAGFHEPRAATICNLHSSNIKQQFLNLDHEVGPVSPGGAGSVQPP